MRLRISSHGIAIASAMPVMISILVDDRCQRPQLNAFVRTFEDAAKQRLAALRHELFYPIGDCRGRILVKLEIVFQIPAHVLAILRRHDKLNWSVEARGLEVRDIDGADVDPVMVRRATRLLI
jgi:hypothetical protein